ncbi:MAG: cell division protein FtsA [Bacteroidales bacterium]|nr:cell division protein FtsA [Bacteroidales bacterium]
MENNNKAKFSPQDKIVVGIDVGTTKIAVFIARKNESGDIEIIGRGKTPSVGVENGDVRVVTKTSESIRKAVEQAENQSGYEVKEAFVGIAGYNISTKHKRATTVIKEDNHIITNEDIQKLIEEQYNIKLPPGDEIIDIVPQNYIIDGQKEIADPVGMIGKSIECNFNLISADVNNIKNIRRSVEMAGYKVANLILQPIASAEAVVDDVEKTAGICLVDIGGGTTDVAIYHEGILRYTSVIQLAGNLITDDIKEGCTIIATQAEALKTKYGDCIPTPEQNDDIISIPGFRGRESREIKVSKLSEIIRGRVEMILDQVIYDIRTSGYEKKLLAGIVLTGGGAMIKNLRQLTEYVTGGIATRIGESDDHLSKLSPDMADIKHPMYATGIGLVIKGFEFYEESASYPENETNVSDVTDAAQNIEEEQSDINNSDNSKEEKNSKKDAVKKESLAAKISKLFRSIISDGVE